jgi:hypothetical protein
VGSLARNKTKTNHYLAVRSSHTSYHTKPLNPNMSTSPTPRRAARGMPEMPSTPTGPTRPVRPTLLTTSSYNIEPKSEYLRHALEARRAKDNASTSPPREPMPTPRRSTSGTQPVDPWVEQAVSEEDVPQMTPIRRARRPSDGIERATE